MIGWMVAGVAGLVASFFACLFVLALGAIKRQARLTTELRRDRDEWRSVVFRVRELWRATSGEGAPVVAFEQFAVAMETIVREVQP